MSQSGKLWIILNPTAGKGKAAKQQGKIDRFLRDSGRKYEIIVTKNSGHALDIVRDLPIQSDDAVVAAGGDGTCNEVVNGLMTRPPVKSDVEKLPPIMGILPVGRGNDFSSTPGIPVNVEEALKVLIAGKTRPLDIGLVKGGFFPQGRYFVNGIGIGFDTKVGFEAAKLKIKSGISYAIGAIITLIRFEQSPIVQIKYDDKEKTIPSAIVSVVNGRRMGGSFYMGPNALLDDGLLDICVVCHQRSRIALLKLVALYTKGKQGTSDQVFMDRGKNFHLKTLEGSMACHCDGETVCYEGKELEISCIPNALRLIA